MAVLTAVVCLSLAGCSAMTGALFPTFGLASDDDEAGADCGEIAQRMTSAKSSYASVLGRERPAVYLSFAGNLSKAMKSKKLKGVHEMTDLQLDDVVSDTRTGCLSKHLPNEVCAGAERLGEAYRPVLLAAHDAYAADCTDHPVR
jgi:hypothetical protein